MSFAPTTISHSSFPPLLHSPSHPLKFSTKLLPLNSPKHQRSITISSSFNSSEQAVLDAVAGFDANQKSLPSVRTFENDLVRLSVVGSVDFQQALTAAAADGGEAADEHVSSGTAAMVVETVFPAIERGTVSTRLFLPARKVKEKAIKIRRSLTKDILDGTNSKGLLAMTFRQVVLQQLWNFTSSHVGVGALIFEVQRSARSEAKKEDIRRQEMDGMRQRDEDLAKEVELLKQKLAEIEQMAKGRGLAGVFHFKQAQAEEAKPSPAV